MKKGMLLVISGPSGSGKGTLVKNLALMENVGVSISATTRKKRDCEEEGKDYYFISREEFKNQLAKGNIIEYNEYCGNFYGTLKNNLDRLLKENEIVILEIDVNGAKKISVVFDCLMIFVLPPSFSILKERLLLRGTETKETINMRLKKALIEIESAGLYDYLIVNENVKDAAETIKRIVGVEGLRIKNSMKFVDEFLASVDL